MGDHPKMKNKMYEKGYESVYVLTAQMDEVRARAKHEGKKIIRELSDVIQKGLKARRDSA